MCLAAAATTAVWLMTCLKGAKGRGWQRAVSDLLTDGQSAAVIRDTDGALARVVRSPFGWTACLQPRLFVAVTWRSESPS